MEAESESNTAPTCFLESSVSFEMVARISDLVGAAFFFAILYLLLVLAKTRAFAPANSSRAENNIEKSRCLAQMGIFFGHNACAHLVFPAPAPPSYNAQPAGIASMAVISGT